MHEVRPKWLEVRSDDLDQVSYPSRSAASQAALSALEISEPDLPERTDVFRRGYQGEAMRRVLALLDLLVLAAPLVAQEALTLRQAVNLALLSNPLVAATDAGEKEAEARIHQARSGYLPRLQFSESLQRGNNPVFVFSSLLTQHQFMTVPVVYYIVNRRRKSP